MRGMGDSDIDSWPPATTTVASPSSDLLRRQRDGAQARAADLVDQPGGGFARMPAWIWA
jgi:hypothetical protein